MPAQCVLGQVGCLPGRTIAFRRSDPHAGDGRFLTERFLGVFLEVSDDRTLTNLTLKAGYRTVYQYTSLVYTDAPLKVKKLFKQQLRWARGSQYNTLRMLPWMVGHAPVLAVFFVADILLPFLLVATVAGWVYREVSHTGANLYAAVLQDVHRPARLGLGARPDGALVGAVAWRSGRCGTSPEKPSDFFRLPVFILVSTAFLMPVRLLGFFRLAHVAGWGTRAGAYSGGGARSDAVSEPAVEAAATVTGPLAAVEEGSGARQPVAVLDRQTVLLGLTPSPAVQLTTAPPAARRRPNPYALLPYLMGASIIALEVWAVV